MSEFSDRPFVAGSLTGIRSFRIDKYGRLMATQFQAIWTPGENVGRCLAGLPSPAQSMWGGLYIPMAFTTGGLVSATVEAEPAPKPPKEHRAGHIACQCGFYAYFDNGPSPYHERDRLRAIVEGYGLCTVGSRGFRSEKARVLALIIPAKKVSPHTDAVRGNYPDVPVYPNRETALAEFPLTPPARPTPETDPEFWTRETL